jgi:hypothetical protein
LEAPHAKELMALGATPFQRLSRVVAVAVAFGLPGFSVSAACRLRSPFGTAAASGL